DAVLLRAWDVASGMGLGAARRRFHIRACQPLGPKGEVLPTAREPRGWSLLKAVWPLEGTPDSTPCRLLFPAPLRLLRQHRLIERPTPTDFIVAAIRRLEAFLPSPGREALIRMKPALIDQARNCFAESWRGQ